MNYYKFCPLCSEKLQKKEIDGQTRLFCSKCGFRYYNNPLPAVTVIIPNKKGEILLTKRAHKPYQDWWDIPGGFLEGEENPEMGLKREIKEELGVEIRIKKLLGIYHDIYHDPCNLGRYVLDISYLATIKKGLPQPNDDITEIKYFPLNKLPKLPFEHQYKIIKDYKKQL